MLWVLVIMDVLWSYVTDAGIYIKRAFVALGKRK